MTIGSPFSDIGEASALLAAVQWLRGTLLGTIATTIAVIAIATIGLTMLNGRLDWRRGVTAIVGCFILFGAPAIAAGILSILGGGEMGFSAPVIAAPIDSPVVPQATPQPQAPYDPYAGASVPSG